jgi:hypothetical protein
MSCCGALRDLLRQGLLEEVRKIKAAAQDNYFAASTLLAFTRINFLTRQTFFRLMRADLQAIRAGVRSLQQRGVTNLDCRRAQLSAEEPLAHVLEMARQWKKPFLAEYSAGNHFVQLAELRTAVEEALTQTEPAQDAMPDAPSSAIAPPSVPAASQPNSKPCPPEELAAVAGLLPATPASHPAPEPGVSPDNYEGEVSAAQEREPSANSGQPVPPPSAAAGTKPPDLTQELQKVQKQLAHYLMANPARTRTVGATIVVGHARLTLSSWEVTAFIEGIGDFTEIVQRGVATRVLLFQYSEQAKQNGSQRKFADVIAAARSEAAGLRQSVTGARNTGSIEATVALSATTQRLISTIAEAEGILKQG